MEVLVQVEVVLSVGVEWRSKVLAARGYPEVDGDGPAVHPAIYVRFHRSIKSGTLGLTETPKNQDTAQSFQRTLQVGHCLIASGPADLSVGFCTVAIVTPIRSFSGRRISLRAAPPSTTLSRPARSLRADPKARTALMLYFNTNVGATLWRQVTCAC